LRRIAQLLAGPTAKCQELTTLSLAQNSSLRLRSMEVLQELPSAFLAVPGLVSLDLSGIAILGRAMTVLMEALLKCSKLRKLNLAGCSLGQTGQADCVAVSALLGHRLDGSLGLVEADLSGNFFGRAGFAAAAAALRRSRLTSLCFAGNGGGGSHWLTAGGAGGVGSTKDPHGRFHPIQLLIEGLLLNRTIQQLDLSDCGLGPDSAFILEDALNSHPAISSLSLMNNPLGDAGLRCVIRLLLSSGSDIRTCRVSGNRDDEIGTIHKVKYRFAQPFGMYRLDMKYPYDRATVRTLLRSRDHVGGSYCFFKFDGKPMKVDKDLDAGTWVVPTQGLVSFAFQPPLSEAAQQLNHINVTPETSRNSTKPSTPSGGQRNSTSERSGSGGDPHRTGRESHRQKRGTVISIAGHAPESATRLSMQGQPSNAMRLSATASHGVSVESDWADIAEILMGARIPVSALHFPVVRSMFLSLITQEQQLRFIRACSKDFCFNGAEVTQLSEDRPELAAPIASSLVPSIRGRSSQLLILASLDSSIVRKVGKSVSNFLWFQEGNPTGKYNLDLERPGDYMVAENCLLVNAWESEVGRLLGKPDVSQQGTYEMLRNEAHNEVPFTYSREWSLPSHGRLRFDYSSIRRPPGGVTAMPEVSEVTRYLRSQSTSSDSKLKALRALSVHMYLSTQQFKNLMVCFASSEDRQDFFCMLHTRVVDPAHLLGLAFLYNNSIFKAQDRPALLNRIGHLHLLNPLNLEGVVFSCNLLVYEERMVIDFLVHLSTKEFGGKVVGCNTQDADGVARTPMTASWADKGVPAEDVVFKCTYETANANSMFRHLLAEKYCVGTFGGGLE